MKYREVKRMYVWRIPIKCKIRVNDVEKKLLTTNHENYFSHLPYKSNQVMMNDKYDFNELQVKNMFSRALL